MKIQNFDDTEQMAIGASDLIVDQILKNPNILLCPATGNTPLRTYQKMVNKLSNQQTEQLRILKLDEWGGVTMTNEQTCEQYLQRHILKPLQISKERYFGFNSNAIEPAKEIDRINNTIKREHPIGLCILGIGVNGHIAFNEPADHLRANCHIAQLSDQSMQHTMALSMQEKPTYGLTLGMSDILQSEMVIMLISGAHKKDISKVLFSKKITTKVPASFLWLHHNVHCFIDKAAYE